MEGVSSLGFPDAAESGTWGGGQWELDNGEGQQAEAEKGIEEEGCDVLWVVGILIFTSWQKVVEPNAGFDEHAHGEVHGVKDQTECERELEGNADVLYLISFGRGCEVARLPLLEGLGQVVSDQNDCNDCLYRIIGLKKSHNLKHPSKEAYILSLLWLTFLPSLVSRSQQMHTLLSFLQISLVIVPWFSFRGQETLSLLVIIFPMFWRCLIMKHSIDLFTFVYI